MCNIITTEKLGTYAGASEGPKEFKKEFKKKLQGLKLVFNLLGALRIAKSSHDQTPCEIDCFYTTL